MTESLKLECWFLHEELALNLLSERDAAALIQRLPGGGHPFSQMFRVDVFQRAISSYLSANDVGSLEVQCLKGTLTNGQLVWLEQAISFKGVGAAVENVRQGLNGRASFSAKLGSNREIVVKGDYSASRLTCSSASGQLSGTKRQYMLGYVESVAESEIKVRPIAFASRWFQPSPVIEGWHSVDPAYVWPSAIDQFCGVDFERRIKKSELNLLRGVPEAVVKSAFADIIGEPEIPNDWGGEQFDLWTSTISVDGFRLRAAFAFKGPAKFHPMKIADLGKNADQVDRLAQTAADLIVVQHCHSITAPVINMMRAYASDSRRPRRYMAIDGYDTLRILQHFGKI